MTSVLDPEPWIKCWEICRGCHKGSEVTTEGLCIYMGWALFRGETGQRKGESGPTWGGRGHNIEQQHGHEENKYQPPDLNR